MAPIAGKRMRGSCGPRVSVTSRSGKGSRKPAKSLYFQTLRDGENGARAAAAEDLLFESSTQRLAPFVDDAADLELRRLEQHGGEVVYEADGLGHLEVSIEGSLITPSLEEEQNSRIRRRLEDLVPQAAVFATGPGDVFLRETERWFELIVADTEGGGDLQHSGAPCV